MAITGIVATEVEIIEKTIQPRCRAAALTQTLSAMHPAADGAITVGVFLEQNPLLEADRFAAGNAPENFLQLESRGGGEHASLL